jgi:hypothetical protein
MVKNAFLSFFLLFSATFAFSQSSPCYKLSITKKASAAQEEINYTLQRSDEGGLLIVKEKIFPAKGSSSDSLYLTTVLEKPSDEQRILLQEFVESKTAYISDSLFITDKKALEEIDLLVSQWNNLVEQSNLKNPNRFVLDGTSFSFSLGKENQKPTGFSIHSPDDQVHPEIIRILRSIELLSNEF